MSDHPPLTSRQVFDEQAPFVWRTLRYLGVPPADLPDVCQEVFITVHRKLESFEGRSAFRTWLYRICQRAASDHRRRAYVRREVPTESPTDAAGQQPSQIDAVSHLEARGELAFALELLDEQKRAVFVLYEVEGLTMREVADVLDCPLQTAYSRLHAARRILSDELEREASNAEGVAT
jgi:RNA polymerase sigma-70 factor (ECF subfamily)